MDPNHDVLKEYEAILAKTKKKFGFKKPDYAGASEDLERLARVLRLQDCKPYAAMVLESKAKCDAELGDTGLQVEVLLEAGELFFATEKDTADLRCLSIQYHLHSGIHCFNKAIQIEVREKKFPTCIYICKRLAKLLRDLSQYHEAIYSLKYALTLLPPESPELLPFREEIITISIVIKEYKQAMVYSKEIREIAKKFPGVHTVLVRQNELTYMLLVMFRHEKNIKCDNELEELVKDYNPHDVHTKNIAMVDDYLFYHMQEMLSYYLKDDLEKVRNMGDIFCELMTPHQSQMYYLLYTKRDFMIDLH
ncbi:Factor VIII intron 22 protein-like [Oopsacas minuta]|uniref:Factor VIII intron 22 protein-like n=1 Tax=Oopsacas minuta TaxID=111878 RepID=A0AAV7KEZ7_9METZ|nr:Factor VIII intron 22 protein-like [Oopsacas minuta]